MPWRLETVNQSALPTWKKRNSFGLCPPPSSFCHPSHPSAKPSTSINLPRNTIIATPLPFSHSSLSGLLSHGASCVCWAPMLESHNSYRWIRLPFSRAWRLEVGKRQVWRWSWGEFMLRPPRPSSPADLSLCVKPIGLEGIMTPRRSGSCENTHNFTLIADPDTHTPEGREGILREYWIALNNCILAATHVHAQPLVCNRQSCKHIWFDIRYAKRRSPAPQLIVITR